MSSASCMMRAPGSGRATMKPSWCWFRGIQKAVADNPQSAAASSSKSSAHGDGGTEDAGAKSCPYWAISRSRGAEAAVT